MKFDVWVQEVLDVCYVIEADSAEKAKEIWNSGEYDEYPTTREYVGSDVVDVKPSEKENEPTGS